MIELRLSTGEIARLEARAGERILDVADEAGAILPASCRSADCGACLVEVEEGLAALEPPSSDELAWLRRASAPENRRLGCQIRVRDGSARVRLMLVGAKRR